MSDAQEQRELEQRLTDHIYAEAKTMAAPTIFEEGMQKGLETGKELGQRELLLLLLDEQFGPLSENVRRRVEELPSGQLPELGRRLLRAKALVELGLDS